MSLEQRIEPQQQEHRHACSVKIDLNEEQDEALKRYIASLPVTKVSKSQAVLTLVLEGLRARRCLPAEQPKPKPQQPPPASSLTSLG